jgi:hypothetical protein
MSQSCFHRMPLVRCVLTVGLVATLMACSDGQNGNRNDDAGGVTTDRAATTTSSASSKPKPGTGAFASRCWSADVPPTSSSSPEATDLNGDGVLDVVVGADGDAGVIAVDGKDGSVLWVAGRQNDVYTAAAFLDANGDGVDDVVMGGRSNDLIAHDGTSGEELWSLRRSLPDLPELWIGNRPHDSRPRWRWGARRAGAAVREPNRRAASGGYPRGVRRDGRATVGHPHAWRSRDLFPARGGGVRTAERAEPDRRNRRRDASGGSHRAPSTGRRTVNTEWSADGTGVVAAPVRTTNPAGEQRIIAATWNGPVRMFDGTGKQLWESEDTSLSSAARPVLVADDDRPGGVVIAVQVNGDTYPPVGSDSVIVWLDARHRRDAAPGAVGRFQRGGSRRFRRGRRRQPGADRCARSDRSRREGDRVSCSRLMWSAGKQRRAHRSMASPFQLRSSPIWMATAGRNWCIRTERVFPACNSLQLLSLGPSCGRTRERKARAPNPPETVGAVVEGPRTQPLSLRSTKRWSTP